MKKSIVLKKICFGIALFGFLVFTSCKDAEKAEASATSETETAAETTNPVEAEAENSEAGDAIALNPAHGLPNHRCDIPVGAPLNSAKGIEPTSTNTSSNISPLRIDQTPKINPPHGEPGHSCSIPVGAPLK